MAPGPNGPPGSRGISRWFTAAGSEEHGESGHNYDTRYTPFSHFQRPFVSLH